MQENEIDEFIDDMVEMPFGITDEEYEEIRGDDNDTN